MNAVGMTDIELYKKIKRYYIDEHFGLRDRSTALSELLTESSRRLERSYSGSVSIFDSAINEAISEIANLDREAFTRRADSKARANDTFEIGIQSVANSGGGAKGIGVYRISGDSMIGAGIADGDNVVVEMAAQGMAPNAFDGKIIVAEVCGVAFVKRLNVGANGSLHLISENEKYPPYELRQADALKIIGEVKQIVHNL